MILNTEFGRQGHYVDGFSNDGRSDAAIQTTVFPKTSFSDDGLSDDRLAITLEVIGSIPLAQLLSTSVFPLE